MKIKKIISISLLISLIGAPLASCKNDRFSGTSDIPSETPSEIVSDVTSDNNTTDDENSIIKTIAISNKANLQRTWYVGDDNRTVQINITAKGYSLDKALKEGLVRVTSSNESVIKVTGTTIKAVGVGKAKISAVADKISDSVEIEVSSKEFGIPTISFVSKEDSYSVYQNEELTLPLINAVDQDGKLITSEYIKVKSDLDGFYEGNTTDNVFKSDIVGTHTVTFEVANPNDATKVANATITVNVYRKLFDYQPNSIIIDGYKAAKEQKITFTDEGETIATLNMPSSNYYYAEATYSSATCSEWYGFSHVPVDNDFAKNPRWLLSTLRPSDKTSIFLDSKNWSPSEDRYHNRIDQTLGVKFDTNNVKYAVARIEDVFYAFVNDTYVGSYTSKYYTDRKTIPAIFVNAYPNGEANNINLSATGIDFYSKKEDVISKVDTLTGGSLIRPYVVNTDYWQYKPSNFEIGKNETDGLYVNMKSNDGGQNACIWSPWTYFASDFTFEFDYEYISSSHGGDSEDGRMWIELRPWTYGASLVEFGAKYSMTDPQFMMDQEGYFNATSDNGEGVSKYNQPKFSEFSLDKTVNKKLHYKITRKLTDTCSEITMTISNPETNTVITTHSVKAYNAIAKEELLISVQNKDVIGKFTNISWASYIK